MTRSLATAGSVLVLALAVSGCGGDSEGAKAGSKASSSSSASPSDLPTVLPTEIPDCLTSALPTALPTNPTEVPSDLANCLPSNLPTDVPTEVPTALPTDLPTELPTNATPVPSQASGAALDACAVVTPALVKATLGGTVGQTLGQLSSFGDPNAKDCFYFDGDATLIIQATTRADQDLPESSYSYAGLPGSEPIPGATRGWVFVFPGQEGADSITSGLILVKGQAGMNLSITVDGHPYTNADLQKLAKEILKGI